MKTRWMPFRGIVSRLGLMLPNVMLANVMLANVMLANVMLAMFLCLPALAAPELTPASKGDVAFRLPATARPSKYTLELWPDLDALGTATPAFGETFTYR